MSDCALLTPLSRSSPSPHKTLYSYEFSQRTPKLGFFKSVLKSRSCPNEMLGKIDDISGQIRMVRGTIEKNKVDNCNCGLNSRSFGNKMLGKVDSRDFAKLSDLGNCDRFDGNFKKNGGERLPLKLKCSKMDGNYGVLGLENYKNRCNWRARSFGNGMLAKIEYRDCSRSSNFSNLDWIGDKNGRIRSVGGSFKKARDGLKLNCINRNSGSSEFLDDGFEFERRSKGVETDENILGRKLVFDGANFGNGEKENNPNRDSSLSSSFDLLELKRELENAEEIMSYGNKDNDLVPAEGSQRSDVESEGGEFVGRSGLRTKRLLRRSTMLAKQVISIESALSLGFVSELWVDTRSWVVLLVEVRPSMLSGEMERFLLEDVCQVGDAVLVQDESVIENEFKMIGLDTLVGYNVITPGQRNVGKVRGYTFNMNSGTVELLELDSFGISIIPASLVSTYGLPVDDVLEVTSDTVVVHEDAPSRVQRLSKGFWDTRNVEFRGDELRGYTGLGKQPIRSIRRRRSKNVIDDQKFRRQMRDTEGDWDLPMDY